MATQRIPLLVTDSPPFILAQPTLSGPVATGSTVTIPIICRRANGFQGPVALAVTGLPSNVLTEESSIAKDSDGGSIRLKIPEEVAPGRYVVAVTGEATVQGRKRTNASRAFELEIRSR
jgi:hypothetical protein